MDTKEKIHNLFYIIIGVGGLLFSRHYLGPLEEFFHNYGANIAFSFGAYFLIKFLKLPFREYKYITAIYTFGGVSIQEIAQSIELYPGTYDPLDFLANTAGIVIALCVDILSSRNLKNKEWKLW